MSPAEVSTTLTMVPLVVFLVEALAFRRLLVFHVRAPGPCRTGRSRGIPRRGRPEYDTM